MICSGNNDTCLIQTQNATAMTCYDMRLNQMNKIDTSSGDNPFGNSSLDITLVDVSKVRVINSPESGKVIWLSNYNSISIIRLRDNKKKVFQGYWTVDEADPTAELTPIGVEFVNKTNLILGLVKDQESNYFWLSMNFKEKKKKIIPANTLYKESKP